MPDQPPPDDPTIERDEPLYLRIFPDPDILVRDNPNQDRYRPRSGCLRSESALSVDLGSLSTPEQTREKDTSRPFHVAMFTAGVARDAGCRVVKDRTPDNPAHALVYGAGENGSLTKRQTRKIAHRSEIVLLNPLAPIRSG